MKDKNITTIFFDAGGVLFSRKIKDKYSSKRRIKSILKTKGYADDRINGAIKYAKKFEKNHLLFNMLRTWEDEKKFRKKYCETIAKSLTTEYKELSDELLFLTFDINFFSLYDDVLESLNKYKKKYRLGVISNAKPSILWVFDLLDIKKYFEGIFVSSIEGYEKPCDEIYNIALSKMNLKPSECLFIDDNERNVKKAESLGMNSILLDRSKQNLLEVLDCFLES